MAKLTTKESIDLQVEHNLGAKLLKRFAAEKEKELDLGDGDVIKLKIPSTYSEYSALLDQAKTRFEESGQDDENYVYIYILENVVTNLNNYEIEQIVFNCPGLTDVLMKTLDQSCGNVISRIEAEAVNASKKELKKTQVSEQS